MTTDRTKPDGEETRAVDNTLRQCGVLLGCACIAVALILPEVVTRPLFGDDSFYLWAAKQISQGVYPFRDFYCIDTAGVLAYFRFLLPFLGSSSVAYWGLLAGNILGTAWLLGVLGRRITGSPVAGIWAGFVFMVFQFHCTPAYAVMGKDMLAFTFVLAGLLLCGNTRWWLFGHLLMGVGFAIKPTLGALWLVWMAGDFWLHRGQLGRWLLRAVLASVTIGVPFLAVTFWAERHGWGWTAFKVNVGLGGGGYGAYWSGGTLYNLIHVFFPILWMFPLAVVALRSLHPFSLSRHLVLVSVLLGGLVNWVIQPMFNTWYFIPFFGGIAVLAGIGVVRLLPRMSGQIALMICAGLFFAFVPATNLRWLKFITDIKGKEKYTLVEHQSRVMAEYAVGNTPPYVQEWVRQEVSKLIGHDGRVGVLVTDGNLLWALRDYRPGFWAVWSPSWNPQRLAEGVASGSADVIVSIEDISPGTNSNAYYDQVAKLRWNIPEQALTALHEHYQPVAKGFGYVIYQKRK
ncbi:MAG: hypothetical protein ABSF10_05035 [Verrucomicrobiota bacterium]|jgi:hypothetical protein